MTMFQVSVSAVALTSGLLIASLIPAAQFDAPMPSAQMNRAMYQDRGAALPAPRMQHRAHPKPVAVPAAFAQMNRAFYGK